MTRLFRLSVAGFICIALGACATQQTDLTPPPAKRMDAKSTLENPQRR